MVFKRILEKDGIGEIMADKFSFSIKGIDVSQKLAKLRSLMHDRKIDVYVVPTDDYHGSEYVGDYFKERAFITGFTGSAGTAIVTGNEAYLFTDGRYFVQAEAQLKDTGFVLQKSGCEGVPTVTEMIETLLPDGGVIGFYGCCMNLATAKKIKTIADKKAGSLYTKEDLIDLIWEDRPSFPVSNPYILDEKLTGESSVMKISRVREKMKEADVSSHLIASLYDIAYLTNLRADDIHCVPVFMSYMLITMEEVLLYANGEHFSEEVRVYLGGADITLLPYERIYKDLRGLPAGQRILIDPSSVNYNLVTSLKRGARIVEGANPSELMRAVKNQTEIDNTRIAHLKDAIVVTKFIYFVKKNAIKDSMTELSACRLIDSYRAKTEGFIENSFDTISAFGPNAAMMHYSVSEESDIPVTEGGFLLVDSGGHYLEGTTDVTRTIAIGEPTHKMKEWYTLVLKGHLRLMAAKFPKGTSGLALDVLARGPLWQYGLDYRCGTGHGVGHILNVHEGPNAFRHTLRDGEKLTDLEPGMITTDEPGIYIDGELGIRIENELLCKEWSKTQYGQYYSFEPLTLVPYEKDAILFEMLSDEEKEILDNYNKLVVERLSPYLTEEENIWLKSCC